MPVSSPHRRSHHRSKYSLRADSADVTFTQPATSPRSHSAITHSAPATSLAVDKSVSLAWILAFLFAVIVVALVVLLPAVVSPLQTNIAAAVNHWFCVIVGTGCDCNSPQDSHTPVCVQHRAREEIAQQGARQLKFAYDILDDFGRRIADGIRFPDGRLPDARDALQVKKAALALRHRTGALTRFGVSEELIAAFAQPAFEMHDALFDLAQAYHGTMLASRVFTTKTREQLRALANARGVITGDSLNSFMEATDRLALDFQLSVEASIEQTVHANKLALRLCESSTILDAALSQVPILAQQQLDLNAAQQEALAKQWFGSLRTGGSGGASAVLDLTNDAIVLRAESVIAQSSHAMFRGAPEIMDGFVVWLQGSSSALYNLRSSIKAYFSFDRVAEPVRDYQPTDADRAELQRVLATVEGHLHEVDLRAERWGAHVDGAGLRAKAIGQDA